MNERTFNAAKGRELRRFHRAVDVAIDELLAAKLEQTRDFREYRSYASTTAFVNNLTRTVDLFSDKVLPLFERQGERGTWEVYLSGLRKLCRDLPESYLFRFVLPMFGLEEFESTLASYTGRWLDGLHAAHRFFGEAERYLDHLDRGEAVAAEYKADAGEDLARLYASLKTWENDEDMSGYLSAVGEFVDTTFELIVVGPIQLYLMLGRDTFTLLFKTLSVGRVSEMREGDAELGELLALHDFIRGAVADSSTVSVLGEVARRAGKSYVQSLREEETRLRGQLPTQDLKRSFIRRYEAGVLFRQTEERD
ncbi:MAG: hypothetical protein ACYC3S_14265 [Chloroflexota bacterium]